MLNPPSESELQKIPRLYETEKIPLGERNVYLHFFCCSSDWWILEYDPKDRLFFAIAKIFEIELGYVSFEELSETKAFGLFEVDRDLHFGIKKVKEIKELENWLKMYD